MRKIFFIVVVLYGPGGVPFFDGCLRIRRKIMSVQDHVVLTVLFRPRAGAGTELETALRELARASRQDAGCLTYELWRARDGSILLRERWASRDLLEQHQSQPFLTRFQEASEALLASPPELYEWEPLDLTKPNVEEE
jgi:quinol monooxygenase YgiN